MVSRSILASNFEGRYVSYNNDIWYTRSGKPLHLVQPSYHFRQHMRLLYSRQHVRLLSLPTTHASAITADNTCVCYHCRQHMRLLYPRQHMRLLSLPTTHASVITADSTQHMRLLSPVDSTCVCKHLHA